MKVKYTPHPRLYSDYYCQHGDGGYFSGLPHQKGYGLGGLVAGLVRSATPLLKNAGKQILKRSMPMIRKLGKRAVMSGVRGVTDVITKKRTARDAFREEGRNVRDQLAEMIADEFSDDGERDPGRPKRRRVVRAPGIRRTNVRTRKRRRAIDILS